MRVLLVAEGQHERGKEDRDGALETLVRRLYQDITQCDLDRVSRKDIHAHHGKGQGYFKAEARTLEHASPDAWNEARDTVFYYQANRRAAKHIVTRLIEVGFEVAYGGGQ